ncbi:MAG: tetratricopeptide repeat protein [Myxococcota bacterium]
MSRRAPARARVVAFVLPLCALVIGCAKPLHEERWQVLEVPRFELMTTLSEHEARAVVREIERFDVLIRRITGLPEPASNVPTRILALARPTQLADLRSAQTIGLLSLGLRSNVIIGHAPAAHRSLVSERVLHQYIHAALRSRAMRPHPSWYEEGLVALLSAARVRGDSLVIGDFPWSLKTNARSPAWGTVDELIEIGPEDRLDSEARRSFLAQSWALVRYLLLERPGQLGTRDVGLQRYLDLVDLGVSPKIAFSTAFGMTTKQAERRIEHALFDREIEIIEIPLSELDASASSPEIRSASRNEVAVALGEALLAAGDPAAAERQFRSALALEADDAGAHAGLGEALRRQARWPEAEAELVRALALAPARPRGHLDLGVFYEAQARVADDPASRERHLARSREQLELAEILDGADLEVQARLGISHLLPGGNASMALDHLNRAAAGHPGSTEILVALAEAHLARGDEVGARGLLQRARPACGEGDSGITVDDSIAEIRARRAAIDHPSPRE